MNRYPLWKNLMIGVLLVLGLIYSLPNLYGEVPAVQISAARSTITLSPATLKRVEDALATAKIASTGSILDNTSLRVRFANEDTQMKARDVIEHALNPKADQPDYLVALNLLSASPQWLRAINALPMYLGLDLRGGVHFLLQVDMQGAITKQIESASSDLRDLLQKKNIEYTGVVADGQTLTVHFKTDAERAKGWDVIRSARTDMESTERNEGNESLLALKLTEQAKLNIKKSAITQNIETLHKRVNAIGVAEPVIQQQGEDRIIVQLPGVQDVASAKDIIGRTATLQVRLVAEGNTLGSDVFPDTSSSSDNGVVRQVAVKKDVVVTGDHFNDAQASVDNNTNQQIVSVRLDEVGGSRMLDTTRKNMHKPMAIILFEKGKGEIISVANIQGEFGKSFQISGRFSADEATRLAVLIRSGSLAAPMEIIEERTIGPSMGAENIQMGMDSLLWGFLAITVFMCIYYMLFGLISTTALAANLLFLVAGLSCFQATLTLPGIAAIALTLGMAIDSNVLINERIREELRNGATPHAAIIAGYDRAFDTILDSNVTTFIVGLMLLLFGSGPIQGFAVVHCMGIVTSLFSAVFVSRMVTNFAYGYRRNIAKLAIGQIWKPTAK